MPDHWKTFIGLALSLTSSAYVCLSPIEVFQKICDIFALDHHHIATGKAFSIYNIYIIIIVVNV